MTNAELQAEIKRISLNMAYWRANAIAKQTFVAVHKGTAMYIPEIRDDLFDYAPGQPPKGLIPKY